MIRGFDTLGGVGASKYAKIGGVTGGVMGALWLPSGCLVVA